MTNLRDVFLDIRASRQSRQIARQADRMSAAITLHNYQHFWRASRHAETIACDIERYFPGTFRREHIDFHAPAAGFCHDFDRSVGAKPHVAGDLAKTMMEARGVPYRDQMIVLYAIANHSAGPSRTALKYEAQSDLLNQEQRLILATTVLADAADACRKRCRAPKLREVAAIKAAGNAPQYFDRLTDDTPKNWMANYAIRSSRLIVDVNDRGWNPHYRGSIILVWDLDENVCSAEQILSIPWFASKHHGCENAAQNVFALNYGIEANGQRWFCSRKKNVWLPKVAA